MSAHTVFVLSAILGWIGVIGFVFEHAQGRMHRYTLWSEMTNWQWTFVYMMLQFAAVIVVMLLYHAVKDIL